MTSEVAEAPVHDSTTVDLPAATVVRAVDLPAATVVRADEDQDDQPNFDLGFIDDFDDDDFVVNPVIDKFEVINLDMAADGIITVPESGPQLINLDMATDRIITIPESGPQVINLDMAADGIITIPESGPPGTVYNITVPATTNDIEPFSDITTATITEPMVTAEPMVTEPISDINNNAQCPSGARLVQNIMTNAKLEGCTINFQFKQD